MAASDSPGGSRTEGRGVRRLRDGVVSGDEGGLRKSDSAELYLTCTAVILHLKQLLLTVAQQVVCNETARNLHAIM